MTKQEQSYLNDNWNETAALVYSDENHNEKDALAYEVANGTIDPIDVNDENFNVNSHKVTNHKVRGTAAKDKKSKAKTTDQTAKPEQTEQPQTTAPNSAPTSDLTSTLDSVVDSGGKSATADTAAVATEAAGNAPLAEIQAGQTVVNAADVPTESGAGQITPMPNKPAE